MVRTSSTVEPTTIILVPFEIFASRSVLSSFKRPLYISFIMAGGIPTDAEVTGCMNVLYGCSFSVYWDLLVFVCVL